tara:strand:+ start:322 stop:651 length:330 start_codon:yes stop_codon:yes gene_type:complete
MLVDPYQDRYFKDGKVIGANYSGPVGNQIRTETDLGLGLPVGGFTDRNKFGILTPPGSTEQGKMEILTPPGSTEKPKFGVITPPDASLGEFEGALENLFLRRFLEERLN